MDPPRSYPDVKCRGKTGSLAVTANRLVFTPDDGSPEERAWEWVRVQKHLVKTVNNDKHLIKLLFRDAQTSPVLFEVSTRKEVDQIRQDISATRERFANSKPAARPTSNQTDLRPSVVASLPGGLQDHMKRRAQNRNQNGATLTFLPSKRKELGANQRALPLTPFQMASSSASSAASHPHPQSTANGNQKVSDRLKKTPAKEAKASTPIKRTRSVESSSTTSRGPPKKPGALKSEDTKKRPQSTQDRQAKKPLNTGTRGRELGKPSEEKRSVSPSRQRRGALKDPPNAENAQENPESSIEEKVELSSNKQSTREQRKRSPLPRARKKTAPKRNVSSDSGQPNKTRNNPAVAKRSTAPPPQVVDASVGVLLAMEKENSKQARAVAPRAAAAGAPRAGAQDKKDRLSDTSLDSNSVLRAIIQQRKQSTDAAPGASTDTAPKAKGLSSSNHNTNANLAKEGNRRSVLQRYGRPSSVPVRSKSKSPDAPPESSRRQSSEPVRRTTPPPQSQSEPRRRRARPTSPRQSSTTNHNSPSGEQAAASTPAEEMELRIEQTPGAVRVTGMGASSSDEGSDHSDEPSSHESNSSSNRDVLIEARLVEDDSSRLFANQNENLEAGDLVQAQPMQEEDNEIRCRDAWKSSRIRRVILVTACLMLAIIVSIVLGFTLSGRESDDNNSDNSAVIMSGIIPIQSPSPTTSSPSRGMPVTTNPTSAPTVQPTVKAPPPTAKPTAPPTLKPVTQTPPPTAVWETDPLGPLGPVPGGPPLGPLPGGPPVPDFEQFLTDDGVGTGEEWFDVTQIGEDGVLHFISDFLEGRVPSSYVEALKDPNSPQSRAQQWLLDDIQQGMREQFSYAQRFSLAVFYYATNGDDWYSNTSWLDHSSNECNWFQNKNACPYGGGYYSQLGLMEHQLSGSIPPEFFWGLSGMTLLDVSRNDIGGPIPAEIGIMSGLGFLILDETSIGGQLPSEFGNLMILGNLHLTSPSLSGTIPSQIGRMKGLQGVSISGTKITGAIPTQLGRLSKISEISLSTNTLGGPIPSELGLATNLIGLYLNQNREISGWIPSEIGKLTNLNWLHLDGTSLSGSIPSEVCGLGNLQEIAVDNVDACR